MKSTLTIFLLFFLFPTVYAQQFNRVYKKYSRYHKILDSFQTPYYKENIFPKLGFENEIIPIAFDSYGGFYPDYKILTYLNPRDFETGHRTKYNKYRYSMYMLFKNRGNYKKLKKGIELLDNQLEKDFYLDLLESFTLNSESKKPKLKTGDTGGFNDAVELFYTKWNDFHKVDRQLIKMASNVDRIVFYIHGYNNPYNLIALQSMQMLELLKLQTSEKILMIPVLWTGQGNKRVKQKPNGEYNAQNSQILRTFRKLLHHFNQAYFTGTSLRKVLNEFETQDLKANIESKISIISHSSGTTVAASLFTNNVSKMKSYQDQRFKGSIHIDPCSQILIDSIVHTNFSFAYPVDFELFTNYYKIPIPGGKYKIFMSAASMPGQCTFIDLCDSRKVNLKFYNVINTRDRDLGKKIINNPNFLTNTALGRDYKDDAVLTKSRFFENHTFINSDDVEQKKHSIFEYMNSDVYQSFLKEFIEFKPY